VHAADQFTTVSSTEDEIVHLILLKNVKIWQHTQQ